MHDPYSTFLVLTDMVHLAERDLPDTGDGKYDYQVAPRQTTPTTGPTAVDIATHSSLSIFVSRARALFGRGLPIHDPIKFIKAVIQSHEHPDAIDDREGLFAQMLYLLCKLPQETDFAKEANAKTIALLYESLPHPPAAYLGSDPTGESWTQWQGGPPPKSEHRQNVRSSSRIPWAVRSADGSGNNPWMPALGQSGRPYARDVSGTYPLAAHKLPSAGLVFDTLLRSQGDFQPHPGGNSSLAFAFALLLTHMLFRTSPTDPTINRTSSYLDLSPLYGTNQVEQDTVRDKAEGRGLLYNDAFAEDRLVLAPPPVSALLVIFNRNHNYIANVLLKINERGRWKDPTTNKLTADQLAQQDEEIFQTARLVNCGHLAAVVFGDYVGGFLGLPRNGVAWCMDPFGHIKTKDGKTVGRGEGNHSSIEFNILYRWHAVTAEKDIQWTRDLFATVFPGKDPETLQPREFMATVAQQWGTLVDPNPRIRTFADLTRGPDGRFDDDAIANILQTATETPAGAYRARGHPAVLRVIEIMTIEQSRRWGVCTMNEFRKYFGLKPFATFEEWNSSVPGVAEAAKRLYGHIDNLELYPGLQAEDCMKLGPGSGLCCGFTMTRAILSDAMALVRGDRFFTTDYTPANLTAWGFQDCARDANNGAFGAALPKLLMRHLSRHYPGSSIYSLFPFVTPPTMTENLMRLGLLAQYTHTDGRRPVATAVPKAVETIEGIRFVLQDPDKFKTTYGVDVGIVTLGGGFVLSNDGRASHDKDRMWLAGALFPDKPDYLDRYAEAFKQMTTTLVKDYSYKYDNVPGKYIDIVGNVIHLVNVRWVCEYLLGTSLKTKENPRGLFTEQEMYDMLAVCALINVPPEAAWSLQHAAGSIATVIGGLLEQTLLGTPPTSTLRTIWQFLVHLTHPAEAKRPYHEFLARLKASGRDRHAIIGQVIGLALAGTMAYIHATANVVDFYMEDEHAVERATIAELASLDKLDDEQGQLLMGYIREAQRFRPSIGAFARVAAVANVIPVGEGKPPVSVQPGDIVFLSFKNAHMDPTLFPDPERLDPRRPASNYYLHGMGFHECMGLHLAEKTMPEIIKAIFRLKNLRRADGASGRMAWFTQSVCGTDMPVYLDDAGNFNHWPGSMVLVYDD